MDIKALFCKCMLLIVNVMDILNFKCLWDCPKRSDFA